MLLAEALEVREKQILFSPLSTPPWRPHRVRAIWISACRSHVRWQFVGYGAQWLSTDSWQKTKGCAGMSGSCPDLTREPAHATG